MAVPEGYTALGRLGYADKGNYAAGTTYMTGDVVYHNGSSYVARKDNMKGVTPVNGNDWKYLARGFAAETMADVQATDTSGVLGTAGAQVVSQSLIDAIADRVMTKLIGTNQIVNNLLATEPGSVLDATQGKALKEYYDRLNSDLGEIHTLNYSAKINLDSTLNGKSKSYVVPQNGIITISCINTVTSPLDYEIDHSGIAERMFCPSGGGFIPLKMTFPVNQGERLSVGVYTGVENLVNSWFIPYK